MTISAPTKQAKLRGLTAAFIAVLSVAIVAALIAIGYLALDAGQQSERNAEELDRIEEINKRLVDCTEPTGECFKKGQERTAEAVVGINEGTLRVIVAAISCQDDGITEQRALSRCTVERASKNAETRP